jgi:hypothetical protein
MTAQPPAANFFSPHVSEVDEPPPYDDCAIAAWLMAIADATFGEVLLNMDWTVKGQSERKALRLKLRGHLPASKQSGYLTTADVRQAFTTEWPYIEVPFYDSAEQLRTWEDVLALLRTGQWVGVALGNPARSPANSKLRRWTNGDSYKHFVALEGANGSTIHIKNPLAPYQGTAGPGFYDGEDIPISEVKAFTDTIDKAGHVAIGMVKRGSQSTQAVQVGIVKEAAAKQAAIDEKLLAAATSTAKQATQNLTAANQQIAALKAQLAAVPPAADCTQQVADARKQALAEAVLALSALS